MSRRIRRKIVHTALMISPTHSLLYRRYRLARSYGRNNGALAIWKWLKESQETTNFTYDLTSRNELYLAEFVSVVTGVDRERVLLYIGELNADEALRTHIRRQIEVSPFRAVTDVEPRYGRRAGWYAVVRATKPRLVVETGVDKGLGSCVLAAALLRNRDEGHPGTYVGTDINHEAGFLLGSPYSEVASIRYGDSVKSLRSLEGPVDVFVNDSDHAAGYETLEYETVETKLSEDAIILGDNAHQTTALLDHARRTGRQFLFFAEEPVDHWYPGAGIGAACRHLGHPREFDTGLLRGSEAE